MGPSGSGKTTLLRLIAHLDVPDAGQVVGGVPASMLFQESRLIDELDAIDNVLLVAGRFMGSGQAEDLLATLLPRESLKLPVSQLSGGMRRKVELCRSLAVPSLTVLLDEPFAGLDADSRLVALNVIGKHLGGRTLVLATHDSGDPSSLSATLVKLPQ